MVILLVKEEAREEPGEKFLAKVPMLSFAKIKFDQRRCLRVQQTKFREKGKSRLHDSRLPMNIIHPEGVIF
jgi:hypothetical protein